MDERTILLVEDNPDDEMLMLRALKKNCIPGDVVVARDGVEALDYLFATGPYRGRRTAAAPRLMLLDLKLPKIDGLQVLQQIRADRRTKHIPVIVFTSSSEEQDIVRSYQLGANSFVQKPIDSEEFSEAARQLGEYWLLLNLPFPQK